ncbi:MAG: hypothetical protein ABI330_11660, partial [Caldimonas sp.]
MLLQLARMLDDETIQAEVAEVVAAELKYLGFVGLDNVAGHRAGPAKLNSPMRVDTAPEGEDIACENWSKYEQKTPPHALSGIQGQGGAG